MGSINNGPRLASFQGDVHATGLALSQCEILRDLGVYKANAAATIQQGQLVALNAAGELILADAVRPLGVAKHNKCDLQTALRVDEPHVVASGTAVALKFSNVSNVFVSDAANGGTEIPAASNYTLGATAGTLTWAAPPAGTNAPANGDTVYVTYQYAMTAAHYAFQGKNFFNSVDDVSVAEGRLAVIQGPATIFTTQFVSGLQYAVGQALYTGGNTSGQEGLFTNVSTGSVLCGYVSQVPSAEVPYLGVQLIG